MSKVTAINEIIEKKNLLRKCQEKHANYVSIDAILGGKLIEFQSFTRINLKNRE